MMKTDAEAPTTGVPVGLRTVNQFMARKIYNGRTTKKNFSQRTAGQCP